MILAQRNERYILGTETYWFTLAPGGAQGFVSDSPFAPKSSVGERSYLDYDPFSAVSIADFSGGIGQEYVNDTTKYYSGVSIDTRSGQAIIGPYKNQATPSHGLPTESQSILGNEKSKWQLPTGGSTAVAIPFMLPSNWNRITSIFIPLKSNYLASDYTFYLRASLSGNNIATGTLVNDGVMRIGGWCMVQISASNLSANTWYYLICEYSPSKIPYFWGLDYNGNGYVFKDNVWQPLDNYAGLCLWLMNNEAQYTTDKPVTMMIGAGEDNIPRVWCVGDKTLYYVTGNTYTTGQAGIAAVMDGNNPASRWHSSHSIRHAFWYRSPADSYAFLWIGFGENADIIKFDGNIGAEQFTTLSGQKAHFFAEHNGFLWCAHQSYKVYGTDGTNYGNSVSVGTATYPIRNMISWNGYLYIGKDDGLYRLNYPTGYPITGTPEVVRVLDFSSMASPENFSVMVEHQGDLFFNIAQGFMRYTINNVLVPISPDVNLERANNNRCVYRSAISALNVLYVGAEAAMGQTSHLFAWVDGKWHPIISSTRPGDMMRSVALEPGFYGDMPRLWYTMGNQVMFSKMPTITQRRYLYSNVDYEDYGEFILSWADGNLRTIDKDWVQLEIDVEQVGTNYGNAYVKVAIRQSETDSWYVLSNKINTPGINIVHFPLSTHGTQIQIKVMLYIGSSGNTRYTPRVKAVVLKYLERPEDLIAFTRTYILSDTHQRSLAKQVDDLRALREAKEPIFFCPVWGMSDNAWFMVHVVNYSVSEVRTENAQNAGISMIATLKLQVLSRSSPYIAYAVGGSGG